MAEIIPLRKKQSGFEEQINNIVQLCKDDLNSINTLILEKLDSSVPLIHEISKYLIKEGKKKKFPDITKRQ